MFYITQLDDQTQIVIEAETSSAFAKSDLEVRPNPTMALENAIRTAGQIARRFATEMRPALAGLNADAHVAYSIKCDHNGLVMLASNPDEGQFRVSLNFKATSAATRALALVDEPPFDESSDTTDQ